MSIFSKIAGQILKKITNEREISPNNNFIARHPKVNGIQKQALGCVSVTKYSFRKYFDHISPICSTDSPK
jgi:hypothetical protein